MKNFANLAATTAALTALSLFSSLAHAQDSYPAAGKPVTIMIGFGAGGGTDIAGRMLADALKEKLGGTFIVENYPGGGGLQALSRVVPANPDGYTLAFVPIPASNMLYLDPDRGGNFTLDDLTPIAMHDYGTVALAVAKDSPYQTLTDLVEDAKSNSNITVASNGALAIGHLGLMMVSEAADVNINWTAITEPGLLMSSLLGGHISGVSDTFSELHPAAQNGDIRFLAVLADEPSPEIEGIPTAKDQGLDVSLSTNRVLIGPAGLPDDVVSTLETAIAEITSDPDYQKLASTRAVQIRYLNAADAKALWQDMDETFGPQVDKFRELSSK
ncbi:tripartite tricarboxylate transporter substrate binding protein [Aureimonas fodinaquatilis]|uniref:Tripartite tricarboxylate transporter substrate binding protein n=1 Tax=Aureimonas fodinaquatilis TaxID=2565783 RepID=A0A5B0DVX6_9HYPH|nr:tripartite tricarboxylate transporter substrate binding protein [Aureimonas fodinaquatilis]KAA0969339.1 tripartite tricarboxylate transporter substrate binding protein [Aureimonas fodinaquatilis]